MYIVAFGTPHTGDFHICTCCRTGEEAMMQLPWGANLFRHEDGRVYLITE
jgi:hypothetical protein